jgi:hypothetical protein
MLLLKKRKQTFRMVDVSISDFCTSSFLMVIFLVNYFYVDFHILIEALLTIVASCLSGGVLLSLKKKHDELV